MFILTIYLIFVSRRCSKDNDCISLIHLLLIRGELRGVESKPISCKIFFSKIYIESLPKLHILFWTLTLSNIWIRSILEPLNSDECSVNIFKIAISGPFESLLIFVKNCLQSSNTLKTTFIFIFLGIVKIFLGV